MKITASLGLLVLAGTAWAGGVRGVTEAPAAGGVDALNPAVQAAPYESEYGMDAKQKQQFNLGARITVDNLKARPYQRHSNADATADNPSPSPLPPASEGSYEDTIKEEDALPPSGRRSLVDAPISVPLPPLHQAPPKQVAPSFGFGKAVSAAPGEISSTVLDSAAPASRRGIDNLKKPPVFNLNQLPGFTPEDSAAAANADYGRRVIGEPSKAAIAVPSMNPAGAAQSMPFPVMVEVKMAPQASAAEKMGFVPAPALRAPSPEGRGESVLTPQAAVTKLATDTGLIVDAAYPVLMSSPHRQTAFLRGWINSEKLMALTLNPLVVRVSVVSNAAPNPAERMLAVPVSLYLSVPAQETVSSFLDRTVGALEKQAGFRWRVDRGYQLARSASGSTLQLTGELPASSVDRLLAYPELLRLEPFVAPVEPAPAQARASAPAHRRQPTLLRKATDLVVLSTAFPWGGILVREIFFWIQATVL